MKDLKKFYVIEGWDLNDSNSIHEFEITTECPIGNSGNHPEIPNGWLGSYNNYTRYSKSFNTEKEAIEYIESQGAFLNDDGIWQTKETIDWENWFVDGWDSYYNGEETLGEFMDSLSDLESECEFSLTDYLDSVSEWWNEN